MAGFVQVVLFMVLLLAGYIYVWRKGALDWGKRERVNGASNALMGLSPTSRS